MLTGRRADGTPYALIGRDALLQTALHHSRLDSERIAAQQEKMERNGDFKLKLNESEFLGRPDTYQSGYDTEVDLILLEAANLLPRGWMSSSATLLPKPLVPRLGLLGER